MKGFHTRSHEELENVCRLFDKDWTLITVGDEKSANVMTASWGGVGILWNKPVAFCFVRPQRHTYTLLEQNERFSLCFLGEEHRAALRLCGSKSGRDTNKFAAAGLTPCFYRDAPYVGESRLVLFCKKLYADDLRAAAFLSPELLRHYTENDFHRMYICEIEQIFARD